MASVVTAELGSCLTAIWVSDILEPTLIGSDATRTGTMTSLVAELLPSSALFKKTTTKTAAARPSTLASTSCLRSGRRGVDCVIAFCISISAISFDVHQRVPVAEPIRHVYLVC